MVKNEEECIFASKKLGLNDAGGISIQGCFPACPETHRPKGCVYDSYKSVWWYSPIDFPFTSAVCGSTQDENIYDCICAIVGRTVPFWFKN